MEWIVVIGVVAVVAYFIYNAKTRDGRFDRDNGSQDEK